MLIFVVFIIVGGCRRVKWIEYLSLFLSNGIIMVSIVDALEITINK